MQAADRFLQEIVRASGIPGGGRRQEVLRELRTHVEDFVLAARAAGHAEAETERLVFAHFGDPREIAGQFARVYRRERAVLQAALFVLSTIAVAAAIAGLVMGLKAGIAMALGVPRHFSFHHTAIESLDILSTAVAYIGLLWLERRFAPGKAVAVVAFVFTVFLVSLRVAGISQGVLVFGLVCGLFLRAIQAVLNNRAARVAVVFAGFGAIGLISRHPWNIASWAVTGLGYAAMTHLATRVDRAFLRNTE
jgi:predicted anti-sigma-YlaC factor YlaD